MENNDSAVVGNCEFCDTAMHCTAWRWRPNAGHANVADECKLAARDDSRARLCKLKSGTDFLIASHYHEHSGLRRLPRDAHAAVKERAAGADRGAGGRPEQPRLDLVADGARVRH